jgi:spore germination cell wall hydrolase CwlJ-like protein
MSDAELLARILYAECNGEPYEGQLMVAQCVIDRINSGYGDTVAEVVYASGQFARPGRLTDKLVEVAAAALNGERFSYTHRILYFRRTSSDNDWYAPLLGRIGNHAYYGYAI